MTAFPHVDDSNRYVRDVLRGRIPSCTYVRQACQRQLDDLERAKGPTWPYRFDKAKAEKVCRFVEKLPHIKGPKARDKKASIVLEPWQSFILTTVFGWVQKSGPKKDCRRFRMAYEEVPKGNGKTLKLAGVGLYMLLADGEPGPEVYSAATSRDQAKAVWSAAQAMCYARPRMVKHFRLTVGAHALSIERESATFVPISADAKSIEGKNPHFAAIDELHVHTTRDVYDNMETAAGKRDQSLIFVITTAGDNRFGVCYQVRTDVAKILSGAEKDETIFGIIYTIETGTPTDDGEPGEDGDSPFSEVSWKKANPNYGVSVDPDHIRRMAAKALRTPAERPKFLTKHLDIWINAYAALFDMPKWDKLADPNMRLEDFKKDDGWVTLDLATHTDMVARVALFRRWKKRAREDGTELIVPHFHVFAKHYLPRSAVDESTNPNYPGWEIAQRLEVTEGNTTDFALVKADAMDIARSNRILTIGYDPWQGAQMGSEMVADGLPAVEVPQTVPVLSEPTKTLQALIIDGDITHDGDPVLAWHMGNVVGRFDKKENVFPTKDKAENKIDSARALIMGLALAGKPTPPPFESYLDEGGPLILV